MPSDRARVTAAQHRLHPLRGRRHDRQAVAEPALEHVLRLVQAAAILDVDGARAAPRLLRRRLVRQRGADQRLERCGPTPPPRPRPIRRAPPGRSWARFAPGRAATPRAAPTSASTGPVTPARRASRAASGTVSWATTTIRSPLAGASRRRASSVVGQSAWANTRTTGPSSQELLQVSFRFRIDPRQREGRSQAVHLPKASTSNRGGSYVNVPAPITWPRDEGRRPYGRSPIQLAPPERLTG